MLARQWFGLIGILLLGCLIIVITMAPGRVDAGQEDLVGLILRGLHRAGVPEGFGYRELEFTANIIMFVPLGFFLGLLMVRLRWFGALIITALTVLIELAQYLFLPDRVASISDVVANSLGGWVGRAIAAIVSAGLGDPHEVDEEYRTDWAHDGDPRFESR